MLRELRKNLHLSWCKKRYCIAAVIILDITFTIVGMDQHLLNRGKLLMNIPSKNIETTFDLNLYK